MSEQKSQPIGPTVDATPARRPGAVTLEGRHVRVEKLDPARHGDPLWQAVKVDDSVWTYLASGPFGDAAGFRVWLDERAALPDPYYYAVIDKRSGQPAGVYTLMEIRPAQRVIEVGSILFAPLLQRTPASTEAQYLLVRYAFEDLGYRRYEWKCNALNEPSMQAAPRLGFTYEGTFRQHMIVKGRSRDTAWFSITDGEWPAVKAAYEAWLAPENFDAAGTQRRSLTDFQQQRAKR